MELLAHIVGLVLTFRNLGTLVNSLYTPLHRFTLQQWGTRSSFLSVLADTCYLCLFESSHSDRCGVLASCGFDLHFPDD